MVSTGILYTDASRAFSVSVRDLAAHFKENEVIPVSVLLSNTVYSQCECTAYQHCIYGV